MTADMLINQCFKTSLMAINETFLKEMRMVSSCVIVISASLFKQKSVTEENSKNTE